MSSISQEHLSLYASDGYVIVEGFLDVGENGQIVYTDKKKHGFNLRKSASSA